MFSFYFSVEQLIQLMILVKDPKWPASALGYLPLFDYTSFSIYLF